MNKNRIVLLGIAILTVIYFLLPGCSSGPQPGTSSPTSYIEITDDLGRTVKLEKIPASIISLVPSNTEILYALGLGDRILAVTDYDDFPPEVTSKPRVGGFSNPDIERIVELAPDVVLASSEGTETFIPQLEARGIKVISFEPKTIDQVLSSITMTGKITGKNEEASQLVASLGERIKAITDQTAGLAENNKPKVFYPVWHDPLMAGGTGTIHDDMITKAGGLDIAGGLTGYASISLEQVLETNPDIIIVGSHGDAADLLLDFVKNDSRLANTNARQTGHIFSISDDAVKKPGPRVADGLELIARIIHPELFDRK